MVAIPDGNRDGQGYSSGYGFEIIDIPHGRIAREVHLKTFGPTGVVTESADHSHFEIESLYASPLSFMVDSPDPKKYRHEIMVFANSGTTPEVMLPYPDFPTLILPPRISADASMIAIEVNGIVQLFRFGH